MLKANIAAVEAQYEDCIRAENDRKKEQATTSKDGSLDILQLHRSCRYGRGTHGKRFLLSPDRRRCEKLCCINKKPGQIAYHTKMVTLSYSSKFLPGFLVQYS